MNWIIFGNGYLNLDLIVRVEFQRESMILGTPFRDFMVTDPGDIERVRKRMNDLISRWMMADLVKPDLVRTEILGERG